MELQLGRLETEQNNPNTREIDHISTLEMVEMFQREDHNAVDAVGKEREHIAAGIDAVAKAFREGGRLFYFGCGTSGRLGVLDASECPPTFGTDPELVQGIIAGGDSALRKSAENAEDREDTGAAAVDAAGITAKDVVVGITASGRTPYVLAAVKRAKELGCVTIGVCNNPGSLLADAVDIPIAACSGPEVIQGSTRLKSGTAQKLVLNMLSTGAMVKTGRVYQNLMVDMRATNGKLVDRAARLVMQSAEVDRETAVKTLEQCDYHVKTAIFMLLTGATSEQAQKALAENGGFIRRALEAQSARGNGHEQG